MGLTKKQVKDMLPSEIDAYCKKVVKKEIDDLGMYKPDNDTNEKS
jgi:hypothetical protein